MPLFRATDSSASIFDVVCGRVALRHTAVRVLAFLCWLAAQRQFPDCAAQTANLAPALLTAMPLMPSARGSYVCCICG